MKPLKRNSMKNLIGVFVVLLLVAAAACTDMDDYLKYTGGKELIYTGKVDSAHARAGSNRVVITGLLISDPKIVNLKVYWNTRQDSLILPIERSAGVDSLAIPIALPEGRYNFELITYDAVGNASVTVFESGSSYGMTYQESLINRPIKAAEARGLNEVQVDMYNSDETALFTEIIYTNVADEVKVLRIPSDVESVTLADIKNQTKFSYQTYYLPEETAVDTFKAVPQIIGVSQDITTTYLKNSIRPIQRGDAGTGKWGTPKDWLFNSNITNQDGGTGGGWSWDDSGVFHFETEHWDGAGVSNGKVWQTFTLPAGTYTISYETGNYGGGQYDVYELVVAGTELPDIDNIGTTLASFHGTPGGSLGGTHNLTFTLDEPTEIATGWVVNTGQNVYLQFRSVKLVVASSGF
ncbi:DUF4998 domain-containing protein [Parachryseolinea silvisoli]|uniref:DUF4998 domain-containing protein n=1 Tax=Parachryseolinea silvisoli TaxID=2873601 RepID=UPI0022658519|nr:DUF4998 domain-containing protein [Parachryseolinea silvisoli]MCD9014843.1 DUF5013 domain-containing protein [Parachryseolinea silvisoli]